MFQLETKCVSSLAKIFPDSIEGDTKPFHAITALRGEIVSYQVAYRDTNLINTLKGVSVQITSEIKSNIELWAVGLAPSELPVYGDFDSNVLRTSPGLYPDPLYPLTSAGVNVVPNQWRALWVSVRIDEHQASGVHAVQLDFMDPEGRVIGSEKFHINVIANILPKQKLIHTEWFHSDCIATYYQVDVFSEKHWLLMEKFVRTAVDHGMNMILTPIFTPPIDTAIGGERPTVQLVEVEKHGAKYKFNFSKLERWVQMCLSNGVEYFEFSHFFTQWGAKHAPKIIAKKEGQYVRVFGWDTDASGPEYRDFLSQFIPELIKVIRAQGISRNSYFHISDEPSLDHLKSYRAAHDAVVPYLQGFPIIDALSDIKFYEVGLVPHPVPANNHISPFLEANVPNLWTYYCCAQYQEVSNRFFAFPSQRNRIIGLQLFKYGISGFLHWGYNFWNSQLSKRAINPYIVTDADCAFPSGDSFLVYPGEDGPITSIRMKVFFEALQDLRALELLTEIQGKEATVKLIEEGLSEELTFNSYPMSSEWLLNLRSQVNQRIAHLS